MIPRRFRNWVFFWKPVTWIVLELLLYPKTVPLSMGLKKVLEGFVFRASKPAIFGVDVLGGKIRKGYRLMNENGEVVGEVREIQREKEKALAELRAQMVHSVILATERVVHQKLDEAGHRSLIEKFLGEVEGVR
jgi:hypothetical protein